MDRQSIPNPFYSDVVTDPDSPSVTDVARIHHDVFQVCQSAYEHVAKNRESWSVLLYGEAGCGKTHLLSRFRKWLAGGSPSVSPALFVGVRMETAPGHVWRHLRRRFAEEMLRLLPDRSTALDAILRTFASRRKALLADAFDHEPIKDLGLDLTRVLEHFASGPYRRLCRAWLMGDALSDQDLHLLNLPPIASDDSDENAAEYGARRVVLALTRICAPAPVVFCFDQIEALGLSQEITSFGFYSRMGAGLIDETSNSLVISTILSSFVRELQNGSQFADYQRISKEQPDVWPLDWDSGQQLIAERLKTVPDLANEKPIAEADLRAFYALHHRYANPRRLIHEARRLFTLWQGAPEQPRLSTEEFLRAEYERLWSDSEGTSESPGLILEHGLPAAFQILGRPVRVNPAKHIDLEVGSGASRVQVAYGNQAHMTSFGNSLKKLAPLSTPATPVCVLRDARLPLSATARKVHERLERLQQAGGKLIRVEAEALAALDAMRYLLSRATSGDLSLDGEPIHHQTVRDWLKQNLPKQLCSLADEISGERTRSAETLFDALLELLQKRKVTLLEEACGLTNLKTEQIEEYARAHPDRVGLFGGARPVVCQAVAQTATTETAGV